MFRAESKVEQLRVRRYDESVKVENEQLHGTHSMMWNGRLYAHGSPTLETEFGFNDGSEV